MVKHTMQELQEKQALSLHTKVGLTKSKLREWVYEFGEDGVYVSFSGGKDSTVLLDIARGLYPNIRAVFVDTGLEYPEIRDFVKTYDNVDWVKPKLTFKQVIEKYGYPFISKEVSGKVEGAKKCWRKLKEGEASQGNLPGAWALPYVLSTQDDMLKDILKDHPEYEYLIDTLLDDSKTNSKYACPKYKYFLDAPFEISNKCCYAMKKSPIHSYGTSTKRKAITAQLASESRLRTKVWLINGCNAFDVKNQISNPMSFWTEQDVLLYIYLNKLPIASVYGEVVADREIDPSVDLYELGIFDESMPHFKTTGCSRTGCMFCGFGCHLDKPGEGRFERMKETHPKIYDYIMRPKEEGGLDYKNIIDWINEHGNTNIRY